MYDIAEGATRTEDLKRKIGSLLFRVQNLELFIDMMRYRSEDEASMMLAQLRLGNTVDGILGVDMAWSNVSSSSMAMLPIDLPHGQRQPTRY